MVLFKEELIKLFEEAKNHDQSKCIKKIPSEQYMFKGIMIEKDNDSIKIYTSFKSFYHELNQDQYYYFLNGWKVGIYQMTLKKYQINLERLELKVRDAMNGSKSMKVLEGHKTHRNMLNKKHENVSKKLNNLTNKK
jgi:phosphoenolpyruvate carboxylase|tara:strand:- start:254 stop:661 length:408 start_codon:yes stop_codon:yes gene_type:complete